MPMRPTSGSQVSLLARFPSFPAARRRVRRPRSRVAIPAESYPRYSSRLSASKIGATAGFRPTKPTIPHIFLLRSIYHPLREALEYVALERDTEPALTARGIGPRLSCPNGIGASPSAQGPK